MNIKLLQLIFPVDMTEEKGWLDGAGGGGWGGQGCMCRGIGQEKETEGEGTEEFEMRE